MSIRSERDIQQELAERGFCQLHASELHFDDKLHEAWLSLTIDYADLPPDKHLPGGGHYRFRRYGRYRYEPHSDRLTRLPHVDYFQSKNINALTGGMVRRFAQLLDSSFANPFLQALIRFDFRQFPLQHAPAIAAWEVQVHLIRIVAESGKQGLPTPEGIHRDGAAFVTVHLAELVNARGGQVKLYDDARQPLAQFQLQQLLDSYYINDAILWHEALPISPQDPAQRAIRSILTFDFHPISQATAARGQSL